MPIIYEKIQDEEEGGYELLSRRRIRNLCMNKTCIRQSLFFKTKDRNQGTYFLCLQCINDGSNDYFILVCENLCDSLGDPWL